MMAYSILPSEIDFQDYSFDFEEYVRTEVGLDITHSAKKNGGMLQFVEQCLRRGRVNSAQESTPFALARINVARLELWRWQLRFSNRQSKASCSFKA